MKIHSRQKGDVRYYRFCPSCKTRLGRRFIDGRRYAACPHCDFTFWNNPKPVVSVLVRKGARILLLQRAQEPLRGSWCLPGGFIEYDETPKRAAVREVQEEVGVRVTITDFIGIYRIDNDPRGIHLDMIYAGRCKGSIKLSREHSAYQFFSADHLPSKIAYKHRQAIRDWQADRSEQRPKRIAASARASHARARPSNR